MSVVSVCVCVWCVVCVVCGVWCVASVWCVVCRVRKEYIVSACGGICVNVVNRKVVFTNVVRGYREVSEAEC